MSVLDVDCPEYSFNAFSNLIKQAIAVHTQKSGVCVASVEEARLKRNNSIVLGKIVAFSSISNQSQPAVVVCREVLCNGTYGEFFTAIIYNQVRVEFMNLKPEIGDQVAFYEPFVFRNPALPKDNIEKLPSHILEIGESLVIFAKKAMLNPENEKSLKLCEKYINSGKKKLTSTSNHSSGNEMIMQDDPNLQKRRKPSIQLPVNPQIPGNTKRLNPQYKYTTIEHVNSCAYSGNLERANMFVVVKEVTKTISTTLSGKFTIICKVIDDSINRDMFFTMHFFTADDLIIKQIERGDILRLHRVQIEVFKDAVDGRVFNSHDIMLFKCSSSDIIPVSVAKKSVFTEDERKRVKHLRNWLNDINSTVLLLENIREEGVFNINCKIIAKPKCESGEVILKVSDGSETSHFQTTFSFPRNSASNNATIIVISPIQEEFLKLNSGDLVRFNVNASYKNGPKLCLHNPSLPYYLHGNSNEILEQKKRIDSIETKNRIDHTELQTASPDVNSDQYIKDSACPSDNHKMSECENEQYFSNKEDFINGLKPRKALFSANYADLSDATEEDNIEILEAISSFSDNQKNQLKEDVTPANTSFGDLIELVKSKYCAPRKLSSIEGDPHENPPKINNHKRDICEHPKLSEVVDRNTICRKRMLNEAGAKNIEECVDDDKTVINLAIQNNVNNIKGVANKKIRLESKSTAIDDEFINIPCSSDLSSKYTADSVLNWLFHPNNKHANLIKNLAETEEMDVTEIIHILDNEYCKPTDFSHYLNSHISRCQLFLIEVVPNPSKEPLDLISGFCNMGCQKFFLFSTIKWDFNEESIPLCPFCKTINQEREMELMFLMEMHVMTTLGLHDTVVACRENAEVFLGCTAKEFVTDIAIRTSRVQMLNEYTLFNTKNAPRTPLLDISVILKDQILCLVNSKLKHPPNV